MWYQLDISILWQPELRSLLTTGVVYSLTIALASTFLSLILGGFLAAGRLAPTPWLSLPARGWVAFARHIPGVFWVLFFYFVFPELLPNPWTVRINQWPYFALVAGIIGLTIDNASYVSDIVRNGILDIPRSEREAAECCGLTRWQQWRCCLLPAMMRRIFPALTLRTAHNLKNSSLCMVIGVQDITWATQQIESITFRGLEATLVATLFYVLLVQFIIRAANLWELRANAQRRRLGQIWNAI